MVQGVITQGTTPEHSFPISFDVSAIQDLRVTYAQKGREILFKGMDECNLHNNTVSVNLTQADTFRFDERYLVEVQIKILTKSGKVNIEDNVIRLRVKKALNFEEL